MEAVRVPRFSSREAAFITQVEEKGIDRFIFESGLRVREQSRSFDERDLVFLQICREHQEDLTPTGRARIYEALCALETLEGELTVGALRLEVEPFLHTARARAESVRLAGAAVVRDPSIRGGEPVLRGTRIPARNVAGKLGRGMTVEEIVQNYPTLDEGLVRSAALWSELHPKRGRPAKRPWKG